MNMKCLSAQAAYQKSDNILFQRGSAPNFIVMILSRCVGGDQEDIKDPDRENISFVLFFLFHRI